MSQNINLFAPAFRKRRQALTFNALAVGLAVLVLALVAVQTYYRHRTENVAEEAGHYSA